MPKDNPAIFLLQPGIGSLNTFPANMRGGAYYRSDSASFRTVDRFWQPPSKREYATGFRCVSRVK